MALSKELEVSRGPIREAIGRLAAEGLIKVQPRRRAEVRSLTPQELIDAYEVREALEVLAVRLAVPRVTEADLARLEQLHRSDGRSRAGQRHRGLLRGERRIPRDALRAQPGNKKLQEVHHRLEGEIGRFQARTLALRGSLDGSLTEHRAILAAIRLRDAEKAAALTAAHVRVPAQRLQATLADRAHPHSAANPGLPTRCLPMPCPMLLQPRSRREAGDNPMLLQPRSRREAWDKGSRPAVA